VPSRRAQGTPGDAWSDKLDIVGWGTGLSGSVGTAIKEYRVEAGFGDISRARSGNSAALSGYMGKSDTVDGAVAAFSLAYADQNERDHAALRRAVDQGKVKAVFEEER
jgi:hypothetical protein